jgi:hypothetical protein
VIAQGFSIWDVTRLEILVIAVETCPVGHVPEVARQNE